MVFLMVLLLLIQLMDLNQPLFLKLNHSAQFIPITWWGYITYLGDGMAAGCILAVVFRKDPRIALMGILAVLGSGFIVQVLKSYFAIPRPGGILSLDEFYQFGDILKSRGFPSGHSSTAFSLVGTFFYARENNKNGLLFEVFNFLILDNISEVKGSNLSLFRFPKTKIVEFEKSISLFFRLISSDNLIPVK